MAAIQLHGGTCWAYWLGGVMKLSLNVKYIEVKNIAAIRSAAGNMTKDTADSDPVVAATSVSTKPPKLNTANHMKKKTTMAVKFLTHAIKLKNSALMGDTSCQCTKAGACQNISDNGKYSAMAAQVAI
jgi:hypothetical protein